MTVDPKDAVLVGTYATDHTAQLVASALETQKIPVAIVINGPQVNFPTLNLKGSRVGLVVSSADEKRAQQIARAFEDPVLPRTGASLLILGTINNLVPILIMFLSFTDNTGAISTLYSLTLFIPNVVLKVFFANAVTVRTFRGAYSTRKNQHYVILYYLSLATLSLAIFLDVSGKLR